MSKELSSYAARLRELFARPGAEITGQSFSELALELFALQFKSNLAYQKICTARHLTPETVKWWTEIPAVPTSLFKELEFTSLAPEERTAVFHSSGTTEQKPSRHFHNAESLAVYEASLWQWFGSHFEKAGELICLTPPPSQAPHSSLIHMFEVVRQQFGAPESAFVGKMEADGTWSQDFDAGLSKLKSAQAVGQPALLLGTAFSFVHLLDELAERGITIQLPEGSRVMETGGYKNRSRILPKAELHGLITARLGVPREHIVCEYGMSELSSQAYDSGTKNPERTFRFPSWSRVQIISPETGREVGEGEAGLVRIHDLANVFSVAAIQTEDLGIRRGDGFELIGRAQLAESRGCSLMSA